jgi:lipopolysaccharide biosynthesis protein
MIERLGVTMSPRRPLDFPSGSMFWCRPAALRPLLDLGLTSADFPDEQGQTDGTAGHAVERLFLASVEKAGFEWLKVAIPDHFEQRDTIVAIGQTSDISTFLARHRFRVTGEAG